MESETTKPSRSLRHSGAMRNLSSGEHSRDPWLAMTGVALLPEIFPHPGLDLRHAGDPAVVVFRLLAHVAQHLRMRQDDKSLLLDASQGIVGDLLGRQIAVAGLRTFRDRAEHVGIDALRTQDGNANAMRLVRDRK